MAVAAIDTHEIVKQLRASGFSEEQAEAVTIAIRDTRDAGLSDLARKTDIEAVRADIESVRVNARETELRLRAELRETELRLKGDLETKIETVRSDLIRWVFGAVGFQTLIIIGAIIALAKTLGH